MRDNNAENIPDDCDRQSAVMQDATKTVLVRGRRRSGAPSTSTTCCDAQVTPKSAPSVPPMAEPAARPTKTTCNSNRAATVIATEARPMVRCALTVRDIVAHYSALPLAS